MKTARDVIRAWCGGVTSSSMTADNILAVLDAAGYAVVPKEELQRIIATSMTDDKLWWQCCKMAAIARAMLAAANVGGSEGVGDGCKG